MTSSLVFILNGNKPRYRHARKNDIHRKTPNFSLCKVV